MLRARNNVKEERCEQENVNNINDNEDTNIREQI